MAGTKNVTEKVTKEKEIELAIQKVEKAVAWANYLTEVARGSEANVKAIEAENAARQELFALAPHLIGTYSAKAKTIDERAKPRHTPPDPLMTRTKAPSSWDRFGSTGGSRKNKKRTKKHKKRGKKTRRHRSKRYKH